MKRTKRTIAIIAGSLFFTGCLAICAYAAPSKVTIKSTAKKGNYLTVNGKPFLIKGMIYNPVPPGAGYDHDFFSDPDKPWLRDGKLMKEVGINAIRIYSAGKNIEKTRAFIRDMYDNFGIYTMVSDWIGLWDSSANYSDSAFRDRTLSTIIETVKALRNEKGLLGWILGNENNYTFSGKIRQWTSDEIEAMPTAQEKMNKKAEIYYEFINNIAANIKKIDRNHIVTLGNGEATFLDVAVKKCTNIDALAIIIYRGKKFGNFFKYVTSTFDKPMLLSEFGCDSYDALKKEESEDAQAEFLASQWNDLYKNTAFSETHDGRCLGGFQFEWIDEWWKHNESYSGDWATHNTEAGWSDGSYYYDIQAENNMNMNEEWFGIYGYDESSKNKDSRRAKKSVAQLTSFLKSISTKIR